ncbi:MAG: DsbA family protein [Anaerolineales bacterium]|nr:DsbA family protein [Anaerolineales bacterium]
MTTKTKSIPQEEQLPDPILQGEDAFIFKRSHFYSVLVVLAFAVGIFVGYMAWGFNTAPASSLPPVGIAEAPAPAVMPAPVIYDIPTEGFPSIGPADAPITIVEFSDYQCPYCARWHDDTYKALMDAYPGKIRFVYRNYPLPFHQNAMLSAQAALCAGDQNSYWQYHDKLFVEKNLMNDQTGATLGVDAYVTFAGDLNLDTATFEECLASEKYKQFVEDDANSTADLPPENGEAAVGGTPTFFINGHRLVGAVPLSYFQQIIDPELAQ